MLHISCTWCYISQKLILIGTQAARKRPTDFEHQKAKFLWKIRDIVNRDDIPYSLIMNLDQTGLKMIPASKWTMASFGAKQVEFLHCV